jgi:hypothetical protein
LTPRQRRTLNSHVSFALSDHYATLAIVQDAIILVKKLSHTPIKQHCSKGITPKAEAQTCRERSPSVEMVESGARMTGKSKEEGKQQKRAREERTSTREERGSAQVAAKRTLVLPRPEYMLVSPEKWEHRKQRDGTYRYDHQKWREESRDPWSVRGNKIGGLRAGGNMWVRIPPVVQVCRKVTGKS